MNPLSELIIKRTDSIGGGMLKSRTNSIVVLNRSASRETPRTHPPIEPSKAHSFSTDSNPLSGSSTLKNEPLSTTTSERTAIADGEYHSPRSKAKQSEKQHFLSKIIRGNTRVHEDDEEEDKELNVNRDEGCTASVFGCPTSSPTRPKYIWVRGHKKKHKEFNRLFLAQELSYGNQTKVASKASLDTGLKKSTTWCARFSIDGKYLATAGTDRVVRVWQVLSNPDEREAANIDIMGGEYDAFRSHRRGRRSRHTSLAGLVFVPYPIREYHGHTGDVLDLSWSKNNFLLSSSMDKTVRLWHLKMTDAIGSFLHPDFVTSIAFHPKDDRFFLSGSLDTKLRLWSITENKVSYIVRAPDLITAVAFTPDGTSSIAGCFGGRCLFYDTEGLTLQTQIVVKSSHGKNSRGSKITGIEVISMPKPYYRRDSSNDNYKLLISSNDSRVRLYDFTTKVLEAKFKGHENSEQAIHANFSDSGTYVISGSEDERTYIWKVALGAGESSRTREDYEYFHSNESVVTVALFAPQATRKLLYDSMDPIYKFSDCTSGLSRKSSSTSLHTDDTPDTASLNSSTHRDSAELQSLTPAAMAFQSTSSGFNANLYDGNIIIAADQGGNIKVFRQDSAYEARKHYVEMTGKKERTGLSLSPTTSNTFLPVKSLRALSPLSRTRKLSDTMPQASPLLYDPHHAVRHAKTSPVDTHMPQMFHERPLLPYLHHHHHHNHHDAPPIRTASPFSVSSWGSHSPKTNREEASPPAVMLPEDLKSDVGDPEQPEPAAEQQEPGEIHCANCGGTDFRARTTTDGAFLLFCKK